MWRILFVLLLFAAPSIPIVIYTNYSVWVGFGGIGFLILGILFLHLETRGQPGNSGHIGLAALILVPIFTFTVSNFFAALIKYVVIHLTIIWR